MTIYNLVIPEERTDKQSGEVKAYWHRVGSAFPQKSGKGYSTYGGKILFGISLAQSSHCNQEFIRNTRIIMHQADLLIIHFKPRIPQK